MAIHFKFKSAVDYDSVSVENQVISVGNLKKRIIRRKKMGICPDFDLIVSDAQSSQVFEDDAHVLPRNSKVIIRRVPCLQAELSTEAHQELDGQSMEETILNSLVHNASHSQLTLFYKLEMDAVDQFERGLHNVCTTLSSTIDDDEDLRIAAMVKQTAADWQRQIDEIIQLDKSYTTGGYTRYLKGRGSAKGAPPAGYVCHRCGQQGHFIQHCPTNGDPKYDSRRAKLPVGIPKTRLKADLEGSYILPDGSAAVMEPDEFVFAKEADVLLSRRPTTTELPPVLRCPLCEAILREAVMIPCCHQSFCDQCIRQHLIEKGECSRCFSTKFRNDDLLPNVALRQAIDRFIQMTSIVGYDASHKQHTLPDMELAPPTRATPAVSRLRIELRKPVVKVTVPEAPASPQAPGPESSAPPVTEEPAKNEDAVPVPLSEREAESFEKAAGAEIGTSVAEAALLLLAVVSEVRPENSEAPASEVDSVAVAPPAIEKDVSGSVKEGGKLPAIDEGEGGMLPNMSEPPSHKEAEGVAVESEISKGKRKKKRARQLTTDGAMDSIGGNKVRKGDRFCYLCGSPEHIARECPHCAGPYPPHPGMFPAGGPLPPAGIVPCGPDMYWHGAPLPHHGRQLPVNFVEGIYGPGPCIVPFEGPMVAGGPYGVPPFMPPVYCGSHDGFLGGPGPMHPMGRPLTREEFMELQKRERARRFMQDQQERDWSPGRVYSRDGVERRKTSDADRRNPSYPRRSPERLHLRVGSGRSRNSDIESTNPRFPVRRISETNHDKVEGEHEAATPSDETDEQRRKSGKLNWKQYSDRVIDGGAAKNGSITDDGGSYSNDDDRGPRTYSLAKQQRGKKDSKHSEQDLGERLGSDLDEYEETSKRQERRKARDKEGVMKESKVHMKRSDDDQDGPRDSQSSRHRCRNMSPGEELNISQREKGVMQTHRHGKVKHEDPDRRHAADRREVEEDMTKDAERSGRRKHRSRSKAGETVSNGSDADMGKRKRRRRRHRGSSADEGKTRENVHRLDVADASEKHGRHKSREVASHSVQEDARWQLDHEQDGGDRKPGHSDHSRHRHRRHQHNGKSKHV